MKLSLIIEAIVRGDRSIAGLRTGLRGIDRAGKQAAGGLAAAYRSMKSTERSAGRLDRAVTRAGASLGHGIVSGARRGILGLIALERRLTITRAQMRRFGSWGLGRIGDGLRYGALAAGGAGLAGIYKTVTTGMTFERYRTQLTGLEGSRAAGEKAMAWVTDFARTTPYEIGEVMDAFIALKAYGIDPTDGSLRTLGDTAGGMGKQLSQAVEMIADAQTGEFERLKEFGVRASVAGTKVTFSFMRNGKQMTRTAKKTGADIQAALMGIFNERFAGGMDRLSRTTEGKWSNLMDRMTFTFKRVWEGGLADSVNTVLDHIGTSLDKAEADGSLKAWAEKTGKAMGDFVDKAGKFDWAGFAGDITSLAKALAGLADALNKAGSALDYAGNMAERQGLIDSQSNVLTSLSSMISGRDIAKENRTRLRALNRQMGYDENAGLSASVVAQDRAEAAAAAKAAAAAQVRNSPGAAARQRANGDFFNAAPWGGVLRDRRQFKPSTWPGAPARPSAPPKGTVGIKISLEPGLRAAPTGMQAQGMHLELNTGRAMSSVA